VPQGKLFQYLKSIGDGSIAKETPDCSVTNYQGFDFLKELAKMNGQTDDSGLDVLKQTKLISTTDFFYPLVEDPYL